MEPAEQPAYLDRITEQLGRLGLKDTVASRAAFGHQNGIKNMRGGTRSPGIDTFERLAPVLKTSAAYLAYGVDVNAPPAPSVSRAKTLRMVGEVAAGRWLEVDTAVDVPAIEGVALAPDPRWPADKQFAVVLRGNSVNRVAPDGAVVACVEPEAIAAGYQPQDGQLVIVERRRDNNSMIERSAKRYRRNGAVHEFWPDSDDPRWQEPITLDPSEAGEDEFISAEVIGIAMKFLHTVQPDTPWNRV